MTDDSLRDRSMTDDHEARVLAFRRARLSRLLAVDGWLSLVGKFPLHEGDNVAGSDEGCDVVLPGASVAARVGSFQLHERAVTFTPLRKGEVGLRRAGESAQTLLEGPVQLTTDLHGAPDRLILGTLSCEIMQRERGFAVRVRDRDSARRLEFPGIEHYPIRHDLRIVARFAPYDPPKPVDLEYEDGGSEHYVSPGAAELTWGGQTYRLDPVYDGNRTRLLLVFADATNRDSTYGAGRFLYAPLPEGDRVVLDFNLAFNPPCAFTPYALCPLPPPQNRLPVRIEAGEKRPTGPH